MKEGPAGSGELTASLRLDRGELGLRSESDGSDCPAVDFVVPRSSCPTSTKRELERSNGSSDPAEGRSCGFSRSDGKLTVASSAASSFRADVTSWDAQVALFDHAIKTFGAVDIAVANAGVAEPLQEISNAGAPFQLEAKDRRS